MLNKKLAKISFFGVLLFGLFLFSGCSQPTAGPTPHQTSMVSSSQPKQLRAQVNTRTRAS